jgi:hypothetical protein
MRSELIILTHRNFDFLSQEISFHGLSKFPFRVRHPVLFTNTVREGRSQDVHRPLQSAKDFQAIVAPTLAQASDSLPEQPKASEMLKELAEDLVDNHLQSYFQSILTSQSTALTYEKNAQPSTDHLQTSQPQNADDQIPPEIRQKVERIRQRLTSNLFMSHLASYLAELKGLASLFESVELIDEHALIGINNRLAKPPKPRSD